MSSAGRPTQNESVVIALRILSDPDHGVSMSDFAAVPDQSAGTFVPPAPDKDFFAACPPDNQVRPWLASISVCAAPDDNIAGAPLRMSTFRARSSVDTTRTPMCRQIIVVIPLRRRSPSRISGSPHPLCAAVSPIICNKCYRAETPKDFMIQPPEAVRMVSRHRGRHPSCRMLYQRVAKGTEIRASVASKT